MHQNLGKYIMLIGAILVLTGLIIYLSGGKLKWLGHLPGDIRIEGENLRFYFPLTTMIIISVVVTLIITAVRKFF